MGKPGDVHWIWRTLAFLAAAAAGYATHHKGAR